MRRHTAPGEQTSAPPSTLQGTSSSETPIPDFRTKFFGWLGFTPRGTIAYTEVSRPQPSRMDMQPASALTIQVRSPVVPAPSPTARLRQFFNQYPWVFYLLVALAVGLTIFGVIMLIIPGLNPHAPSNINENGNQFRHVTEAPKPLQSNTNVPAPRASTTKEVIAPSTSTSAATISKKVTPTTTSTHTATTSKSVISSIPSTSATAAECPSPKGSFLDTCQVTGSVYQSTDPNLQSTTMCKYDLQCKRLDGTVESTTVYVQKSMRGCLKFFENCDGQPVIRDGNERVCTTPDVIARESRIKMDL